MKNVNALASKKMSEIERERERNGMLVVTSTCVCVVFENQIGECGTVTQDAAHVVYTQCKAKDESH